MIQEIKTENKNFPVNDFSDLGYESHIFGQKSYNGVALITKKKITNINIKLLNDKNKQSRIISGDINIYSKNIKLINIYAPNGNPINTEKYDYKKYWFNMFIKEVKKILTKNKNIIIGGDFNIIPEKIDVYDYERYENDALFKLEIRKKFRELIILGFCDGYRFLNKDNQEYTFWDYMAGSWNKNYGMRIDHFLVSNSILGNVKNISINKEPRGKFKPSDHTPIELEIN